MEKSGKAEFKVFGKKHTVSWNKPSEKPTTRAPEKTDKRTSASTKTSSSSCSARNRKRAPALRTRTITRVIIQDGYNAPVVRACNGALYPQACLHYASVFNAEANIANDRPTCTAAAL